MASQTMVGKRIWTLMKRMSDMRSPVEELGLMNASHIKLALCVRCLAKGS